MASIDKRGAGYRVRYRTPDGKQRTKSFDRKIDAQHFAASVETDKARGEYVDLQRGRVTVGEWAATWSSQRVNLRASTRARDASYLRTHVLPEFGAWPLTAVEHEHVQAWIARMAAKRAPATVRKAAQILAKLLDAAVKAKRIKTSPCVGLELPKIEREEMRFLTPAEVATLADAIDGRYRALVLVAAYGGLRIGELAGLKRHRVDVLRGRVEIAEIAVEVQGDVVWNAPKTRAGRRAVSLPRPIMNELDAHMRAHSTAELVFPSPEGYVLRTPSWRRRIWAPAIQRAGLEPLRPHDLRHTAVALWIAAGANGLEVSRRAGHTSTSFTLDRYGHLFPEADTALSDRLAALYEAAPPPSSAPVAELVR